MLLIADFGRYWLHRAFHKFGLMWRFHAVHHSPRRLYWLNVGRFHPIEKAVQYVFDALPFTLVGVSGDVLAGYFTFYAVNGFYQHSNCLVWLGRLNYVISGPELHRWHHSMLALVWCLTNTLMNLRVLLAVGCVALPRVVTATARHRALPTTIRL